MTNEQRIKLIGYLQFGSRMTPKMTLEEAVKDQAIPDTLPDVIDSLRDGGYVWDNNSLSLMPATPQ